MSQEGEGMIQNRVYKALVSGGLKDEQLKQIADDPDVAKEAAFIIKTTLDRMEREKSKSQGPVDSGSFDPSTSYFW